MSERHLDPRQIDGFDGLAGAERGTVLDHARECAGCRARLVADDPARLFAFLDRERPSEPLLERLTASIGAELDRGGAGRIARRPGGPVWGSVAASLLLAGLIGLYLLSRPAGEPPRHAAAGQAPVELAEEAHSEERSTGIELLSPAEAQVYDLSVGETQIVMIFDRRLDI